MGDHEKRGARTAAEAAGHAVRGLTVKELTLCRIAGRIGY